MKKIYESIPSIVLLIISWTFLLTAAVMRSGSGLDLPLLNVLFIIIGLGAFYLPVLHLGRESGEPLRRKLLWLLVLASIIVFGSDLIRLYLTGFITAD